MIKLERGPAPKFFTSPRFDSLRVRATEFYNVSASRRRQQRFDFVEVTKQIYPAVAQAWLGKLPLKCAYCENVLPDHSHIGLHRPRGRATRFDGTVDEDHYWWLVFDWENYLPSCKECQALKGTRFPIASNPARVWSYGSTLHHEQPLLLDPCVDEPSKYLIFLNDGRVASQDIRGQATIDVLGLNRDELVVARRHAAKHWYSYLRDIQPSGLTAATMNYLRQWTSELVQFAGLRRQFLKAWAENFGSPNSSDRITARSLCDFRLDSADARSAADLKSVAGEWTKRTQESESFSVASEGISRNIYQKAQFIQQVDLVNIRGFQEAELRLPISGAERSKWYMLLGENGTCKSTILKMIAAALVGHAAMLRMDLRPADYLRPRTRRGEVRVHLTGLSEPIVLTLERSGKATVTPAEPKVLMLAYGATRLLTTESPSAPPSRLIKVDNLFNPREPLNDGRPWLLDAGKAEFDRLARSLSGLLPHSDGAKFTRRRGAIHVATPNATGRLAHLSSGYQAIMALALDIMSVMHVAWQDMDAAEGIVLVDEIDAHLHPRWKMRVIDRLRRVFPRIQFIVTSHEPLTLRGLERDEIAILKRTLDGRVHVTTSATDDLPSPQFMRVDQLLCSEYFGLHSTEDLELDHLYEEYYTLQARRTRTANQEQRLVTLRGQLDRDGQFGITQREQLALAGADAFLAQRKQQAQATPELRRQALATLQKIWEQLPADEPSKP
jgi:hypothetical protein